MPEHLSPESLERDLAVRDLTDESAGPHALQLLVALATGALAQRWGAPIRRDGGPRVVPIADNYDNLGFTADAASRDGRYSRYVDEARMLRSHSSAMIPGALRALADDGEGVDDVVLACPGVVYRRDAIDRLHTGTPHQIDLWRISRRPLGVADLDEMCAVLIEALAPGREWRWEPRVHPYTLEGRQIDVLTDEGWVEVWECGLAHPEVLRRAGVTGRCGLALGMGLDRLLMIRKGIPDIRLLRTTDVRVATQMLDLDPYVEVSSMPAVVRDLSVAVPADDAVEDLGDRVRDALGDDAGAVEEVALVAETPYSRLPRAAVERMGMSSSQKNVLVRVVLRRLERTMTAAEANELRDRVYGAIHRGSRHEWAR